MYCLSALNCKSTLSFVAIATGTHHGGGNADVQMVHTSRWVVVVQVVVHMLMRALPVTHHHMFISIQHASGFQRMELENLSVLTAVR